MNKMGFNYEESQPQSRIEQEEHEYEINITKGSRSKPKFKQKPELHSELKKVNVQEEELVHELEQKSQKENVLKSKSIHKYESRYGAQKDIEIELEPESQMESENEYQDQLVSKPGVEPLFEGSVQDDNQESSTVDENETELEEEEAEEIERQILAGFDYRSETEESDLEQDEKELFKRNIRDVDLRTNELGKRVLPHFYDTPNISLETMDERLKIIGEKVYTEHFETAEEEISEKDPRPIRDRKFQQNCIKNILNFLKKNEFSEAVGELSLQTPKRDLFERIFKFIYSIHDENHQFSNNISDEVVPLLTGLGYPYIASIQKSTLSAVGTPSSWPIILAALDWMVSIIKIELQVNSKEHMGTILQTNSNIRSFAFEVLAREYCRYINEGSNYQSGISETLDEIFRFEVDQANRGLNDLKAQEEDLLNLVHEIRSKKKMREEVIHEINCIKYEQEKYGEFIESTNMKLYNRASRQQKVAYSLLEERDKLADKFEELKTLGQSIKDQLFSLEDVKKLKDEEAGLLKEISELESLVTEHKQEDSLAGATLNQKISELKDVLNQYDEMIGSLAVPDLFKVGFKKEDYTFSLKEDNEGLDEIILFDFGEPFTKTIDKYIAHLASDVKGFEKDIETKEKEIEDIKKEIEAIEEQEKSKRKELDNLRETYKEKKDTNVSLINALKSKIEEKRKLVEELDNYGEAEVTESKNRVKRLRENYTELYDICKGKKSKIFNNLASATNDYVRLKSNASNTIDQIYSQLDTFTNEFKDYISDPRYSLKSCSVDELLKEDENE